MPSCITEDYKIILTNMVQAETDKAIVKGLLDTIPLCTDIPGFPGGPVEAGKRTERHMAERWPSAQFINAKREVSEWDSPSKLYTHLTGERVSGSVCDLKGEKCRALSLVDNFLIAGFIVKGDGEDPPPSAGTKTEVERAHTAWKDHLNATGKKFIVIHPEALKEAVEEVKNEVKKKESKKKT